MLVCAAANLDHAALIRESGSLLGQQESGRLALFAARRLRREPVSRILGHRAFWDLDYAISPAVLDPRPETEGLVACVLDAIGGRRDRSYGIVDLGTGSGAVLGALLTELPLTFGFGVDRSEAACRVTRHNLARLGLNSRSAVICADWAHPIRGEFDVVVSNPPYVETDDLAGLDPEVRGYDPPAALDGGTDGLDAYRAIAPCLATLTRSDGIAAFECGAGQGRSVALILEEAGLSGASVYKDLAGHDRIVIATRPA